MWTMIYMQVVLVVAALLCFVLAIRYDKIEQEEEETEERNKAISMEKIFVNDALEE